MYTINMADNTGLFIVLMIACAMSIVSAVLMSYTCTGGTWDFDNFKASKCVEIPEDETDSGSGDGSGFGVGSGFGDGSGSGDASLEDVDPASLDNSEHYALCSGAILSNDAKTCWNEDEKGAGVRWEWSQAQEQALCQGYASKYRIIVSSSYDEHVGRYYYDKSVSSANSFRFKNAPNGWLKGHNVKFVVSALTSDDKRVITPFTVTLDAGESTDDCGEVGGGTATDWSEMKVVPEPDERPPPPPPTDCSGGTWENEGGCMVDGVAVDIEGKGPACIQKQVLKGDDFISAAHGGTCVSTKYSLITRESENEFSQDPPIDCVLGPWFDQPIEGWEGCTKTCGGGVKRQARSILVDDENGGEPCGDVVREKACNTQDCPIDCVGGWRCDGWIEYDNGKTSCGSTKITRKKRDCTYNVSQQPNSYGTPCPTQRTKTEDVFVKSHYNRCH